MSRCKDFDENGLKICNKCKQNLPKEFYPKAKNSTGFAARCKPCINEACRKYKRKYFLKNKDEINKTRRELYKENPENRVAWSVNNPDKTRQYKRKWKENNKHNLVTGDFARRTRMKCATPKWLTDFDKFLINEIYRLASDRTMKLKIQFQVDHIVPIMSELVCGLHCPDNLQIIPYYENYKKGNRYWPNMPEKEM